MKKTEINDESKNMEYTGDSMCFVTTSGFDRSHDKKKREKSRKKRKFEKDIILTKKDKYEKKTKRKKEIVKVI
jgi:hypothetical protein